MGRRKRVGVEEWLEGLRCEVLARVGECVAAGSGRLGALRHDLESARDLAGALLDLVESAAGVVVDDGAGSSEAGTLAGGAGGGEELVELARSVGEVRNGLRPEGEAAAAPE